MNKEILALLQTRLNRYSDPILFDDPEGVGVIVPGLFHFSILVYPRSYTLSWLYSDDLGEGVKFKEFLDLDSLISHLDREFFPKEEVGK